MVEAGRAGDLFSELIGGIRGCFVRVKPWIQAGKYVRACLSDLGKRNGWSIVEWAGDANPDKTQRLLNHAYWDAGAAVSVIRRFVIGGLDAAAGGCGLRIAAADETGQQKAGDASAGVKRRVQGAHKTNVGRCVRLARTLAGSQAGRSPGCQRCARYRGEYPATTSHDLV
jgi:hypothetical protein